MKFGMFSKVIACSLVVITVGCLASLEAYSQARPSSKTNVISIDPLGLALNDPLNVQYEIKAGPVTSWAFRLHYWPSPKASTNNSTGTWSGLVLRSVSSLPIAGH